MSEPTHEGTETVSADQVDGRVEDLPDRMASLDEERRDLRREPDAARDCWADALWCSGLSAHSRKATTVGRGVRCLRRRCLLRGPMLGRFEYAHLRVYATVGHEPAFRLTCPDVGTVVSPGAQNGHGAGRWPTPWFEPSISNTDGVSTEQRSILSRASADSTTLGNTVWRWVC